VARGLRHWARHRRAHPRRSKTGYDLALVTTDTAAQMIERYAARWSIEVAIEDARQLFGAGQARNRTARAVERTIPFQLACQASCPAQPTPEEISILRLAWEDLAA
jgi:hypothetical protein